MEYILGVDGGGTKTLALLGDLDGNVLGRGVSGPSNTNAVGFDAACSALESAINMARRRLSWAKYPRYVWDWRGRDEKKILSDSRIGQSINFQRQR